MKYFYHITAIPTVQRKSKGIIKGISWSVLLWCIFHFGSCNQNVDSFPSLSRGKNSQLKKHELSFKEIHKLLYENPTQAREKAFQLLDSMNVKDSELEVTLLKHIGSSYVLEAHFSKGLEYFHEALSKAEDINYLIEVARIHNNIGVIYNDIGNLKQSYIHFMEALSYYDLAGEQSGKTGTLNNIGLIYIHLGNFEKALTYFEDVLHGPVPPSDTILITSVLNNMAICYLNKNYDDLALEQLERAIKFGKTINNQYGLSISYQLKGDVYLKLEDTNNATSAYSKSKDIAINTHLPYQLALAKLGIAKAYLLSGKTTEALSLAHSVMDMAKKENSLVFENESHLVLSDIYEKKGDYKKSLRHFKNHMTTRQKLSNQTVMHQIYDLELNHLSQQNKMHQLELEKKELAISKQNNFLFFTLLIFLMLFTGMYLIYLNHRHRQKVKLQKTIIELTEKNAHAALEAEIQERKRIGQELHDSLGHLLSVSGLHAGVLLKRKDFSVQKRDEVLQTLMKTIDDAFTEVRNISHNLAPSLLSEYGLKGALKSISEKINQSTKLKMSYKTFGLNQKLESLVENTLYRTIQEIVNNTIKHSTASELFIQITQGNQEITLMAEDNGKGFDPKKIKTHTGNGLSNMRSRIENLKGSLFIDTSPNRGTIISILIPI